MSRTIYVPLKIVCGADVFAGTPFLSFTEYLPSVVRLALAALLTAAALANIGNSACAQRILWKRRRNGQAKHISVEQMTLACQYLPEKVATVRQSTFRLNGMPKTSKGFDPDAVATVRQSTFRLNSTVLA